MHVEIPSNVPAGTVNVKVDILGTLGGKKLLIAGEQLYKIDGESTIEFQSSIEDGLIRFDLLFPDPQRINEVYEGSDERLVSFRISSITVTMAE